MKIILSPLKKALDSLKKVLDLPKDDIIRDSAIQRFEYSFELSWKLLKRYLEVYEAENADSLSKRELFRMAWEKGLINDPVMWFEYLQARNITSHAYDEQIAEEVYEVARKFLPEAIFLLHKLEEKIND